MSIPTTNQFLSKVQDNTRSVNQKIAIIDFKDEKKDIRELLKSRLARGEKLSKAVLEELAFEALNILDAGLSTATKTEYVRLNEAKKLVNSVWRSMKAHGEKLTVRPESKRTVVIGVDENYEQFMVMRANRLINATLNTTRKAFKKLAKQLSQPAVKTMSKTAQNTTRNLDVTESFEE